MAVAGAECGSDCSISPIAPLPKLPLPPRIELALWPDAQPQAAAAAAGEKRSTKVVRKFSLSPRFPRKLLVSQRPEDDGGGGCSGGSSGANKESRSRSKQPVPSMLLLPWGKLTTDQLDGLEACTWLMEAGFPQYVQLFEERRLPTDPAEVAKDHSQLSESLLKPLYRRLQTLAKLSKLNLNFATAGLKLDCTSAGQNDQGAVSFKWHMDKKSKKWSHVASVAAAEQPGSPPSPCVGGPEATSGVASSATSGSGTSSCDSALGSGAGDSSPRPSRMRARRASAQAAAAASSAAIPCAGGSSALSQSRDSDVSPVSSSESAASSEPSSTASSSSGGGGSPILPGASHRHPKRGGWAKQKQRRHRRRQRNGSDGDDDDDAVVIAGSAAAASTSVARAARVVIGEPVLIRSAETEERLRRLGCLDLADAVATRAVTGCARGSCRRDASGVSCVAETVYVLPASHVPGTFPVTLEPRIVRRICPGCTRVLPSVAGGSRVTAAVPLATIGRPCLGVGVGSGTSGHASLDAVATSNSSSCVSGGANSAPEKRLRRQSWYDNVPVAVKDDYDDSVDSAPPTAFLHPAASKDQRGEVDAGGLLLLSAALGHDQFSAEATAADEAVDAKAHRCADGATAAAGNGLLRPPAPHSASQEDRRDSGVGLSLTREPVSTKPSRKQSKKSLLQRGFRSSAECCHAGSDVRHLTAGQLSCLRKLCLLKVTAMLEEHCPRDVANSILSRTLLRSGQKSISRPEPHDGEGGARLVFCMPLYAIQQTEGHPLPAGIRRVMASLRHVAHETVGIFRRPGVKSRIQKLRNDLDAGRDVSLADGGTQAYDLADLLKQFFRELPECLLTDRLSELFLAIHQYVPLTERAEAMRAAMMLLPCENRQALRALLDFMAFVAGHASTNQMTASNLAVCFAPSLFSLGSLSCVSASLAGSGGQPAPGRSPKVPRKNSGPSADHIGDLLDQKHAHECLKQMLDQGDRLFQIPEEFAACTFTCRDEMLPCPLTELLKDIKGGSHRLHVDECIRCVLKELGRKSKGWTADCLPVNVGKELLAVAVSHKPMQQHRGDGSSHLPMWKASIEVEAPPVEVLTRLVQERHLWDDFEEVRCCRKTLDGDTELVHFTSRLPDGQHPEGLSAGSTNYETEHILLRSWRTQLDSGTCALVSHSVDPSAAACSTSPQLCLKRHLPSGSGGAPGPAAAAASATAAITYASHYLVEPCGAGKSRVTHLSCVDLLGRLPAWYERHYACRIARSLVRLRESFRRQHACMADAAVPETSV